MVGVGAGQSLEGEDLSVLGATGVSSWCRRGCGGRWGGLVVHGSGTDVATMCLLCGAHHSQVEAGHYRVAMVDGVPHVTPPPWVDPTRTTVRNRWWQDRQAAATLGHQLAIDLDITPPARSRWDPWTTREA